MTPPKPTVPTSTVPTSTVPTPTVPNVTPLPPSRALVEAALEHEPGGERRRAVAEALRGAQPLLTAVALAAEVDRTLWHLEGLGPLEAVLVDPRVTDVLVNGDGSVWIERAGRLARADLDLDAAVVLQVIERIVAPRGLRVDRSSPWVDTRLADGSRVNAVVPPLAVDGPLLAIRRFGAVAVPLSDFGPPPVVELLAAAVAARRNLVVAGGTGSGKTTLLNAMAAHIPPQERVITIEDAAELRLGRANVVRLEARPPNVDGVGAIEIRELVRNALRMRPDRLVVGEVRGGEALDMVQAMNTGHDGTLSTCHANRPADAVRRIETMVLLAGVDLPLTAVREQIAASIDLVVQVARTGTDRRRVVDVAELEPELRDGRVVLRSLVAGADRAAGPGGEPGSAGCGQPLRPSRSVPA